MHQEIESRYRIPNRTLYERLLQLDTLGPFTLLPLGWQRMRDCYLDTREQDLARQSWACRLRRIDGLQQSITLKGPAAAVGPGTGRIELEMRLPQKTYDVAQWPPCELTDQIKRLVPQAQLAPVAQVRQRRYRLAVREDERLVAYLSVDRMRVRVRGSLVQRYLAECELTPDGGTDDLQRLDALLVNRLGLIPEQRSKQQLALLLMKEGQRQPPTSPRAQRLRPKDSPSQAAAKILGLYFEQMLAHEPGVREGQDPEAVHQMRVATRRMRSALRFLGPFVTDARLQRLVPRLRRLGRLLGAVRDLDVALERARSFAEAHSNEKALQPLLESWERQRARHLRRLKDYLDRPGYGRWLRRWRTVLARLQSRGDRRTIRMGHLAPLLVYLHWRIVWAYDGFVVGAPPETLHALRIECKRLRYGLECCADVLPARILPWTIEITALQDHLGDLNDHATAIVMLDAALTQPAMAKARPAIAAYSAFSEQQMAILIGTLESRWAEFSRRETQRAFEALIRG